jgi:hypothetical protein
VTRMSRHSGRLPFLLLSLAKTLSDSLRSEIR